MTRWAATGLAIGLHLVLLAAIGLSLSRDQPRFADASGGATLFASLTRSSVQRGAAPSSPPPAETPKPAVTQAPEAETQTRAQASTDDTPKTDTDEPGKTPSASADAPAGTAAAASGHVIVGPVLVVEQNPWARASVMPADASLQDKLWALIKPCWRGDAMQPPAAIRVTLDPDGRVQAMTSLEGGDQARARAKIAADAIVACSPFKGVVKTAGDYLVVAPRD